LCLVIPVVMQISTSADERNGALQFKPRHQLSEKFGML
jgi:hypothetical protein